MDRLRFLKSVPFFEDLFLEELMIIEEALWQEEFLPSETVFEEGDRGNKFYMIYEGVVGLYSGPRGQQKLLATLKPGDYFGEMALFDDTPRSATAVTESPCRVLTLVKDQFHELMLQRPEILFHICKALSKRLRDMNQRLTGQREKMV
jgi:CRP-like cAMP-binding protein